MSKSSYTNDYTCNRDCSSSKLHIHNLLICTINHWSFSSFYIELDKLDSRSKLRNKLLQPHNPSKHTSPRRQVSKRDSIRPRRTSSTTKKSRYKPKCRSTTPIPPVCHSTMLLDRNLLLMC